jgi:hypothetical protein
VTAWATGRNETWHHLKKGFKHLSVEYAALGDKASQGVCVKFEVLQGITVFQLHHGGQFYWWRKPEYLEKTTDKSLTNFIT